MPSTLSSSWRLPPTLPLHHLRVQHHLVETALYRAPGMWVMGTTLATRNKADPHPPPTSPHDCNSLDSMTPVCAVDGISPTSAHRPTSQLVATEFHCA
jgi:hypothetical protein